MDPMSYANAIGSIESDNDYGELGPKTRNGDRAYGRFQVMGNNIPDWTERHYGQRLSPDEFLQNKEAQDAVFRGEFGSALSKYGNPQDAASVWQSGRPLAQAAAAGANDGYLSTVQYVDKFNRALGNKVASDDDNSDDEKPALGNGRGVLYAGDKPSWRDNLGSNLASAGAALAGITSPGQAAAIANVAAGLRSNENKAYRFQQLKDGSVIRMDPYSGRVEYVRNPSADVQPATTIEDLQAISPTRAAAAQAVNEGRVALPNGTRLNPAQQQLRDDVFRIYPGVDANTFAARKKFQEGKASAQPTALGGLLARSEIAADQLDKTLDSYGKLGNTDNSLGVYASKAENFAGSGGTELGNIYQQLGTNAKNASSDINAVQNGGRGGQKEREEIEAKLNLPYDSPKVQSGAVQAHVDALRSAIESRFAQERTQLGEDFVRKDPDYIRLQSKLQNLQEKADKLYKGDFSYATGSKSGPAAQPNSRTTKTGVNWSF
jgi:hypothetical protein